MNKRAAEGQGGTERYGGYRNEQPTMNFTSQPARATAAQMANRKIANAKSSVRSGRNSRANTPTANPFGGAPASNNNDQNQSQSMSFNPNSNSFTFSAGPAAPSAPTFGSTIFSSGSTPGTFGIGNGATPQQGAGDFHSNTSFQAGSKPGTFGVGSGKPPQQNGGSTIFGSSTGGFGGMSRSDSSTPQPQQNGFATNTSSAFGSAANNNNNLSNNTVGSAKPDSGFAGFGQNNNNSNNTTASSLSFGSFSNNQPNNATNNFGSFGQSQAGQNGTTPFAYDFACFGPKDTSSQQIQPSSFIGSNSSQQPQNTPGTAATSFGTSGQPQPNGGFTSFGSKPSEAATNAPANPFAGFSTQSQPQINDENSANPFSRTTESLTPSAMPADNSEKNTGLFGSPAPPPSASPNLGNSVLSGLNQNSNAIKPGMFTTNYTNSDSTPKSSSSGFTFGQTGKQNETSSSGGFTQPQQASSLFNGGGSSQQKPAIQNMFGAAAQPAQTNTVSTPSTGQDNAAQDTSMNTPETTPQKPSGFIPVAAPSNTSSTPFKPFASTANPSQPSQPSKPFSFAATATAATEPTSNESASLSKGKSLFERVGPSSPVKSAPSQAIQWNKPVSGPVWNPPTAKLPTPPFSTSSQPQGQEQSSLLKTTPSLFEISTPVTSTTYKTPAASNSHAPNFEAMNNGLLAHLRAQDPHKDWTPIFEAYIATMQKFHNKDKPLADNAVLSQTKTLPQPTTDLSTPKGPANPAGGRDLTQTAPVNNRKRPSDDEGVQPPATEKRSRIETTDYAPLPSQASTTAKLFQSVYNNSDASKKAGNAGLSSVSEDIGSPQFGPPKSMVDKAREDKAKAQAQNGTSSGFTPTTSSSFTAANTTSKFTATGAAAATTSSGFIPSSDGFKPTSSAASGFKSSGFMPSSANTNSGAAAPVNFLSAFGKKASVVKEEERAKRKAEDYDSDDDDEAAWEAKDKAEQEAKRQKIMESAKQGSGFTFKSSTSADSSGRANKTADTPKPSIESPESDATPMATGRSLFKPTSAHSPPATEPPKKLPFEFTNAGTAGATPSLFSNLKSTTSVADKNEAEKSQGTGDNTWKPSTPLKFGGTASTFTSTTPATAPPKINLFGSVLGNGQPRDKTPPGPSILKAPNVQSSLKFDFASSSANGSRSATPGTTTDGEGGSTAGDADEAEEATAEPQLEDQTGLRSEELLHEDVLLSVPIAKALKWVDHKRDPNSEETKPGWLERGKGPLYILKHKETGKYRVILKVPPFGKACMNFQPIKGMSYVGASAKSVKGPFMDHLDTHDAEKHKVSTWLIQVGKPEDAKMIEKLLVEAAAR